MKWSQFMILLFLVGLFIFALQLLLLVIPSEPAFYTPINTYVSGTLNLSAFVESDSSRATQFYPLMRFKSSSLTYTFDGCQETARSDVVRAFALFEENTPLRFSEQSAEGDITVLCERGNQEEHRGRYYVAGEGGPTLVLNTSLFTIIKKGSFTLYEDDECDEPHIAVHEMLHVLGFNHSANPNSILYPRLNCDQVVDEYLFDELNKLYSVPSKAELVIQYVESSKSGIYLSFFIEVENRGLADAEQATLALWNGNRLVDTFDLGSIDSGTIKKLRVQNIAMPFKAQTLTFKIDPDNTISELDENNNVQELTLNQKS